MVPEMRRSHNGHQYYYCPVCEIELGQRQNYKWRSRVSCCGRTWEMSNTGQWYMVSRPESLSRIRLLLEGG